MLITTAIRKMIENARKNVFCTAAGTDLLKSMYLGNLSFRKIH